MLTEDRARTLLDEAGATIDVPPDALVVARAWRARTQRRLTVFAAAAVVVGVVVGAGALTGQSTRTTPSPDPAAPTTAPSPPTTSQTPTPSRSFTPVQVATIPPVEGLGVAHARRLLARRGFSVLVDNAWACNADGRVVDSEPRAGRALRVGTTVTVYRTRSTPEMC